MIKELYTELCMCGVFSSLLEQPLLVALGDYCSATDPVSRIRAYSRFAGEIYSSGGSLSELVCRLVLEDENEYVRACARGESAAECIAEAAGHELAVLSRLASLTSEDFRADMGLDYVCPFASHGVDLPALYAERMRSIDRFGYGVFASHGMFRLSDGERILPITSADDVSLTSFVGYEEERQAIIDNTLAFVEGRPAANALLCGDAGTGKSSTVKAVANHFFDRGIRLIELRKDQLRSLPFVMDKISGNPLKFIIFIDDLSFNRSNDDFNMLKAALEGSASAKAKNAIIYATSNRRHIIRESFDDREGTDVHRNDTMQETLSLSERFGLVVLFQKPSRRLYLDIVHELAARCGLTAAKKNDTNVSEDVMNTTDTIDAGELDIRAEAFALRRGSRSARCAEQFVNGLLAEKRRR